MGFSPEKKKYYEDLCRGFRRDITKPLPIRRGTRWLSFLRGNLDRLFFEKMTFDPKIPKCPTGTALSWGKATPPPRFT
jgi:hypothetical protein